MLFTINDLGFSIAGLLLEGWLAFAARCVCALALLFKIERASCREIV